MSEDSTEGYPAAQLAFFLPGKAQIVFRGDNATVLRDMLAELTDSFGDDPALISDILNGLNAVESAAVLISGASHTKTNAVGYTPPTQAAPGRPAATSDGTPICGCGQPRVYRSGNGPTGAWAAFYCPQSREQQCTPRSIKTTPR